jgi:hypothetical protein
MNRSRKPTLGPSGRQELAGRPFNGATITLPVRLIPSLKGVRPKDLRAVEILGRGVGLHWESLDLDLSVPGLVSSVFPSTAWLAELGRHYGKRGGDLG